MFAVSPEGDAIDFEGVSLPGGAAAVLTFRWAKPKVADMGLAEAIKHGCQYLRLCSGTTVSGRAVVYA